MVMMWVMVMAVVIRAIRTKGSIRIVAVVIRKHIEYHYTFGTDKYFILFDLKTNLFLKVVLIHKEKGTTGYFR